MFPKNLRFWRIWLISIFCAILSFKCKTPHAILSNLPADYSVSARGNIFEKNAVSEKYKTYMFLINHFRAKRRKQFFPYFPVDFYPFYQKFVQEDFFYPRKNRYFYFHVIDSPEKAWSFFLKFVNTDFFAEKTFSKNVAIKTIFYRSRINFQNYNFFENYEEKNALSL